MKNPIQLCIEVWPETLKLLMISPSQYLHIKSQQWKHNNLWNLFKVNKKDTGTMLFLILNIFHRMFGRFYCWVEVTKCRLGYVSWLLTQTLCDNISTLESLCMKLSLFMGSSFGSLSTLFGNLVNKSICC